MIPLAWIKRFCIPSPLFEPRHWICETSTSAVLEMLEDTVSVREHNDAKKSWTGRLSLTPKLMLLSLGAYQHGLHQHYSALARALQWLEKCSNRAVGILMSGREETQSLESGDRLQSPIERTFIQDLASCNDVVLDRLGRLRHVLGQSFSASSCSRCAPFLDLDRFPPCHEANHERHCRQYCAE